MLTFEENDLIISSHSFNRRKFYIKRLRWIESFTPSQTKGKSYEKDVKIIEEKWPNEPEKEEITTSSPSQHRKKVNFLQPCILICVFLNKYDSTTNENHLLEPYFCKTYFYSDILGEFYSKDGDGSIVSQLIKFFSDQKGMKGKWNDKMEIAKNDITFGLCTFNSPLKYINNPNFLTNLKKCFGNVKINGSGEISILWNRDNKILVQSVSSLSEGMSLLNRMNPIEYGDEKNGEEEEDEIDVIDNIILKGELPKDGETKRMNEEEDEDEGESDEKERKNDIDLDLFNEEKKDERIAGFEKDRILNSIIRRSKIKFSLNIYRNQFYKKERRLKENNLNLEKKLKLVEQKIETYKHLAENFLYSNNTNEVKNLDEEIDDNILDIDYDLPTSENLLKGEKSIYEREGYLTKRKKSKGECYVISGDELGNIFFWNYKIGERIMKKENSHFDKIYCIEPLCYKDSEGYYSMNNEYFSTCSFDQNIKVWRISRDNSDIECISEFGKSSKLYEGSINAPKCLCGIKSKLTKGNLLIVGYLDGRLEIFDYIKRNRLFGSKSTKGIGHKGRILDLCMVNKEKTIFASTGEDRKIICWDLFKQKPIQTFTNTHDDWVSKLEYGGENLFYSASDDSHVKIWNLKQKKSIGIYRTNALSVSNLKFSFSKNVLIVAHSNGNLSFHQVLKFSEPILEFKAHNLPRNIGTSTSLKRQMNISPSMIRYFPLDLIEDDRSDSFLVSGSQDSVIKVWNIEGKCLQKITQDSQVLCLRNPNIDV